LRFGHAAELPDAIFIAKWFGRIAAIFAPLGCTLLASIDYGGIGCFFYNSEKQQEYTRKNLK
jgi:hypothetical protein